MPSPNDRQAHGDSVIRRSIDERLKVAKTGKQAGPARNVNNAIEAYNAALGNAPVDELEAFLNKVSESLRAVDGQKQVVAQIDQQVDAERKNVGAMVEVMELAKKRAELQVNDPRVAAQIDDADAEHFWSSEVSHGANPLKMSPDKKRTVGDALAQQGEIHNVHQTQQSLVGSDSDGEKRLNAEVGSFYPERYRRASFSRRSASNETKTKGLQKQPPDQVLPKYAAVNLAGAHIGALDPTYLDQTPLHFVLSDAVVENRTTFTASDSLRQWKPNESDNTRLRDSGMVDKASEEPPVDDKPWQTGPIATHGSPNLSQLLAVANVDMKKLRAAPHSANPAQYVEAQVHGEIRIDRDIKHVRANFAQLFGNPRFETLYKTFRENKTPILWYWHRDGSTEPGVVVQDPDDGDKRFRVSHKQAKSIWRSGVKRIRASKRVKQMGSAEDLFKAGWLPDDLGVGLHGVWLTLEPQDAAPATGEDVTNSVVDGGSSSDSAE